MRRNSISLLSAVVLVLLPAATAGANASAPSSQRHCVATAGLTGRTAPEPMRCYQTFGAAINAATGGRVNLRNASSSRKISRAEIETASPLTVFILAIDYHDANFTGSTLTWQQSTACGFYQAGSMPSGWNDVISSVDDFSGCANTLYHDSNFGGSTFRIGVNGSAASLGSFNDQTSSQKWCPVYPCV